MDNKTATSMCSEWSLSASYKNGSIKECRLNDVSFAQFYPNGSIKLLQYDVDDVVFRYSFYESGSSHEQVALNERLQKHGQCLCFSENSKIKYSYNYVSGQKNGECIDYYDNGDIKSTYLYSNGVLDGEYSEYY